MSNESMATKIAYTRNKLKTIMELQQPQSDNRLSPEAIQKINSSKQQLANAIYERFLSEVAGKNTDKMKKDILEIGARLGFERIRTNESTPQNANKPAPKPTQAPAQSSPPKPLSNIVSLFPEKNLEQFRAGLLQACEGFAMTMSFIAHAAAASALAIGGSQLLANKLGSPSSYQGSGEIARMLGIGAESTSIIGEGLLVGVNSASIIIPTIAAVYWLYKHWANEKPGQHL